MKVTGAPDCRKRVTEERLCCDDWVKSGRSPPFIGRSCNQQTVHSSSSALSFFSRAPGVLPFRLGMEPQFPSGPQNKVEAFGRQHRTGLVTLLFTDMVGSTALKQKLGIQAAAELFRRHHELIRETLRQFPQGEEIETAGDSFLLVFGTPSDAVRFALSTQVRLQPLAKESGASALDRIGIHLGEVVVGQDEGAYKPKELFGIEIDTCSRVMSLANAGQVLMTRSVFDSARQALKGEDLAGVGALE